jgi:hypothetical protein
VFRQRFPSPRYSYQQLKGILKVLVRKQTFWKWSDDSLCHYYISSIERAGEEFIRLAFAKDIRCRVEGHLCLGAVVGGVSPRGCKGIHCGGSGTARGRAKNHADTGGGNGAHGDVGKALGADIRRELVASLHRDGRGTIHELS